MRLAMLLLAVASLAGCSSEPSEEERQAAVAEVEANQAPAPEELQLQPIEFADIEANDLFGAGCNFVADGGGAGSLAIAMAETGYVKKDGEILEFAADTGSAELPYLARREYDGKAYSFTLDLDESTAAPTGIETSDYSGSLTVFDPQGRPVYQSTGIVQCGA